MVNKVGCILIYFRYGDSVDNTVEDNSSVSSSSSSSSFYLPNNTTVYTFAWIRFRRAGQQGP